MTWRELRKRETRGMDNKSSNAGNEGKIGQKVEGETSDTENLKAAEKKIADLKSKNEELEKRATDAEAAFLQPDYLAFLDSLDKKSQEEETVQKEKYAYVLENDGNIWLKLSEDFRIGYVVGFFAGKGIAEQQYKIFITTRSNNLPPSLLPSSYIPKGTTTEQMKDGIDAFYKDFANRKIKLVDTIGIVSMQIRGKDPKLIEAQIRYLRTAPEIDAMRYLQEVKEYSKYQKGKKEPNNPLYYRYIDNKKETLKAIEKGLVSKESFLRAGYYCDEQGNLTPLICYGIYKYSGDSIKNAIKIIGARNECAGIRAEYEYLSQKFGERDKDWKLGDQSCFNVYNLEEKNEKIYDKMYITLSDGTKKTIYFDITEYFGK